MRIEAIASLVDKDAKVLDIGTDHAYLPIYLYQKNITKFVTGSDISKNALEYAKKNLERYNLEDKINLIVSNGFKNIEEEYDTVVISGMGTETIKKILEVKRPEKLILSSHNNVDELRRYMASINYKIDKEIVIKENNIYYDIIKYVKGKEELSKLDILVGKSNNLEYIAYLKKKYERLYKVSKNKKYLEYIEIIKEGLFEF